MPYEPQCQQERADRRNLRWEEHRQTRYEALIDQVMDVIRRYGCTVSMDQIAKDLGTSKSIIYRYFGDKVGLQRAVADRFVNGWKTTVEVEHRSGLDLEQVMEHTLFSYFSMLQNDPHVYVFMTSAPPENDSIVPLAGEIDEALLSAISAAVPSQGSGDDEGERIRSRVWAVGMVSFVRGVGEHWLNARHGAANNNGETIIGADQSLVELDARAMTSLVLRMIISALGLQPSES